MPQFARIHGRDDRSFSVRKSSREPGEATLKHPNTDWLLVFHEAGPDAPIKQMHNHWGVRVATTEEVDRAYEYLIAHKAEYKLGAIGKPIMESRLVFLLLRRARNQRLGNRML